MSISDDMKKIFLAGLGAMVATAEKGKEIVDALIEKGEITIEQGKAINEELKRNLAENKKKQAAGENLDDLFRKLDTLSKEDIAALKAKLSELE
jgi:polyhydroxyalkanoate synthesis regulator phasin